MKRNRKQNPKNNQAPLTPPKTLHKAMEAVEWKHKDVGEKANFQKACKHLFLPSFPLFYITTT